MPTHSCRLGQPYQKLSIIFATIIFDGIFFDGINIFFVTFSFGFMKFSTTKILVNKFLAVEKNGPFLSHEFNIIFHKL